MCSGEGKFASSLARVSDRRAHVPSLSRGKETNAILEHCLNRAPHVCTPGTELLEFRPLGTGLHPLHQVLDHLLRGLKLRCLIAGFPPVPQRTSISMSLPPLSPRLLGQRRARAEQLPASRGTCRYESRLPSTASFRSRMPPSWRKGPSAESATTPLIAQIRLCYNPFH